MVCYSHELCDCSSIDIHTVKNESCEYVGDLKWLVQDYALNLYLRQTWRDPRLEFHLTREMSEKFDQIKMEEDKWSKLWLPDTFFRNEKDATYHDVTVANHLLRINASGHVWYTSK